MLRRRSINRKYSFIYRNFKNQFWFVRKYFYSLVTFDVIAQVIGNGYSPQLRTRFTCEMRKYAKCDPTIDRDFYWHWFELIRNINNNCSRNVYNVRQRSLYTFMPCHRSVTERKTPNLKCCAARKYYHCWSIKDCCFITEISVSQPTI